MTPRKRPWVRVLVVLAFAVYTLLYAELFIRVFSPQAVMPRYVTGTSWGVRGNVPNAVYWHHTPEVTVQYRINSQGMRAERDYPLRKAPGTCRVAVYGDSFFVGYELPLEETFAIRLEQELQRRGIHAEVLNFSVSGFGQAEMIKAYEGFGRQFDPDLVLFEWQLTDPDDNLRSGLFRLKNGSLEPGRSTYLPSVALQDMLMRWRLYRVIADNSHLYTFLRERAAMAVKRVLLTRAMGGSGGGGMGGGDGAAAGTEPQPQPKADSGPDPGMDLSAALLLHAQDMVQKEGRAFYVVSIPRRVTRTQFRSYAEALPPTARERLVIIDPTAAFMAAAGPDRKVYYEQGAGHLTPMAVDVLTQQTINKIESSPAFAACRSPEGETSTASSPLWSRARGR